MAIASYSCFAIVAPGLEPIVARELTALGERPSIDDGGVSWEGDARSLMQANLWLRTASRILVRVAQFKAIAFYELERRAKRIPWDRFVAHGRGAEFRVTARKSKLYHSDAIAQRLVDAAGLGVGANKPHPTDHPPATQLFIVRVFKDQFTISADTSGELLHKRGYRQDVGKAPLRETLAAALLLASDWTGRVPLLDPFCGSGTIPIEAALIARRLAPGLHRRFAYMEWPEFDARTWNALLGEAKTFALAGSPVPLLGSDRDASAIESARANAERAGVAGDVELGVRAVSALKAPDTPGLVATNPPYGVRLSSESDVRDLYARFGQVLRERCAGWRVAIYASEPRLAKQIELPFTEILRTSNGGIRVAGLVADVPSSSM